MKIPSAFDNTDQDGQDAQKMRLAMLLSYNGMAYNGSQTQIYEGAVLPTVQSTLQQAVETLCWRGCGPVLLGSRTDAGVHARGAVAQLDVDRDALINTQDPVLALNAVLPQDISVRQVVQGVDPQFHCKKSATHRWYRYWIRTASHRDPLTSPNCLLFHHPLDLEKMQQACHYLLGEHNFKSFKCLNSDNTNDHCRVEVAKIWQPSPENLYFDIVANRFLYKMVRSLMGQLLAIGRKDRTVAPQAIQEILANQDRTTAGETAPAQGLTLMAIRYPSPLDYFANDGAVQDLTNMLTKESCGDEDLFSKAS